MSKQSVFSLNMYKKGKLILSLPMHANTFVGLLNTFKHFYDTNRLICFLDFNKKRSFNTNIFSDYKALTEILNATGVAFYFHSKFHRF